MCGAVLDIKERSNKSGKKYAFLTVSQNDTQYELSIFSENLYKFRYLLKEGNLLIFDVDIVNNNGDLRLIIKNIKNFHDTFDNILKKITIYCSPENLLEFKNKIIQKERDQKQSIDIFLNINNKLVNIKCDDYSITSFKNLENFQNSKILDYSLELS